MRGRNIISQWVCVALWMAFSLLFSNAVFGQSSTNQNQTSGIRIQAVEGKVEYIRAGAQVWETAHTNVAIFLNAGDRVRIAERSRLTLLLSDNSVAVFKENTQFALKEATAKTRSRFNLLRGLLYFFHRDKPTDIDAETQTASAVVRGTEFALEANDDRTVLTVFDGQVELNDKQGNSILLQNLEQGEVENGKSPVKRPVLNAINVIQWILYYPGVLEDRELDLTEAERSALRESVEAYRSGDLLNALYKYPSGRKPASEAEKVYLAAVFLAVGQVEEAETLLNSLGAGDGKTGLLASSIRQLIATVKLQRFERQGTPELATEWLAESYYRQGQSQLEGALQAARQGTVKSPEFGYAWARVAELEFSFGHINGAREALGTALRLSPRNAQAIALKGFILAAENKISSAIVTFDEAIAIDPGLGNAWLGRGLCRIKQGDADGGRKDLLVAAASEPQRGFTRSYLGKAYANEKDFGRAEKELELAKSLDEKDPTAWLYSALLKEQQNRINEAVGSLEYAQNLNTNRQVYRSQFLLDQDRAVRSANLARIYRDAGMTDWSVREAGRAVADDYGNYSAHLFLASSYDEWRDPNRVNLRYETPAEAEYLIANLLAPAGAGLLSQNISQQEYSRLFEQNGFGLASLTEYLSRGAWLQNGAVHGTFGNSSFNLEEFYQTDPGQRINNDIEWLEFRAHIKQQLTPQDSLYFRFSEYHTESGDLAQYYDPERANSEVRVKEEQEPMLAAGYHHEWNPGVHTLFLASAVDSGLSVNNPTAQTLLVDRGPDGLNRVEPMTLHLRYDNRITLYSGEAQQIWQTPKHLTIGGVRFQEGEFHTKNLQTEPSPNAAQWFIEPAADQDFTTDFQRFSIYGYHNWQIIDSLALIGGVSYDRVEFPQNFRSPPITDQQEELDRVSPKAGFVWTPYKATTLRGAYTRSLSGASIDQSLTLEPTQVAGLNQSFRSLKPESIGGAEAGSRFETFSFSFEQRFKSQTYLTVAGDILDSERQGVLGVFDKDFFGIALPNTTPRNLNYNERALVISLDQLVGRDLSFGARYRVARAKLEENYPQVLPPGQSELLGGFEADAKQRSTLQQLEAHTIYNHPVGVFAIGEALWNHQTNGGYTPALEGDDFWQFNVFAGYRFFQRRAEVTVGVLNVTDQNYRLNPLTLYTELPRERTFICRFRLSL